MLGSIFRNSNRRFLGAKNMSAKVTSNNLTIVEAAKKNLPQSPWKMNFLVKLIRGKWVPDALAQLKFSPKHRAVDVAKIVKRASSIAKIFHGAIAEELIVKEVIVNKGLMIKKMRIMGRGRTGFGYKRKSHVIVKVEKVNFEQKIKSATNLYDKKQLQKQLTLVNKIKQGLEKKAESTVITDSQKVLTA